MYFEDFKTSRTFLLFLRVWNVVACSRLSDSGEDAKEKGTRKVGGARKTRKEGRESLQSFILRPSSAHFQYV